MNTVTVTGLTRYTQEEFLAQVMPENINHTLYIWLRDRFEDKVSVPFVETYEVEITGRNSIAIHVYEKSLIACISYMDSYLYLDKDGVVVGSSDQMLEDVPYVKGLKYSHFVLHEQLPVADTDVFETLLSLSQMLTKYELPVDQIYISEDLESTLTIGNVRVQLGNDQRIPEKIAELKDFYQNLAGYAGVLDMTEYKDDSSGYTLKLDGEEK